MLRECLRGDGDLDWLDGDEPSELTAVGELHDTVDLGEQGVIGATADVFAGFQGCSALTNQDGSTGDDLAAEALDAEPLCIGVAAVF